MGMATIRSPRVMFHFCPKSAYCAVTQVRQAQQSHNRDAWPFNGESGIYQSQTLTETRAPPSPRTAIIERLLQH